MVSPIAVLFSALLFLSALLWLRRSMQRTFDQQLAEQREVITQELKALLDPLRRDTIKVNDLVNLVLLIDRQSQRQEDLATEVTQIRRQLGSQQALVGTTQESVARLERVLAGPSMRGRLGERLVEQQLQLLPGEWVARNVLFPDGRVVEFALRTPTGRLIPIDSKWTATELLDRYGQTEDDVGKRKIEGQIQQVVIIRALEVTKYLDEHRTIGFCIAAVPDPVFQFCHAIQPYLIRKNVVLISYSLLVPYILVLINLLFTSDQAERTIQAAHTIKRTLLYIEEIQQHIDRQVRRTFDNVKLVQNQHLSYNQQLAFVIDKARHIQQELDEIQQFMPGTLNPLNIAELSTMPNTLQYHLSQVRESLLGLNSIYSESQLSYDGKTPEHSTDP